jgi:signal transduction histidine kinase
MIVQFKQEPTLYWQRIAGQAVLNLLELNGESNTDPCRLTGSSYNEETTTITADNRSALFFFHFHKLTLNYLFGRYPEALLQARAAERNLDAVIANLTIPVCHFYMALVRLAMFEDAPKKRQNQILKKVASIQKKLKKWAHHAPINNLHKWHLVEAELARVTGEDLLAMTHYDQAIAIAGKHDFPQEAALANELAGRFHSSKGRSKLAQLYLREAYYGYQQWGAIAKVKHMAAHYPGLLIKTTQGTSANTAGLAFTALHPQQSTDTLNSEALDLATVMKAAQAISGEIVLGNLLKKLMRIAIENAGAQRAALLLETNGEWRIEAEGNVNAAQAAVSVLQSRPLTPAPNADGTESTPSLPISLIQYVGRSRKTLVLHDACRRRQFMNNPYISQNAVKSILCAPIIHQGKLIGILYLENNLTEGVFTADRLEVLKILSAQAAISIVNARVYENLESTVAQRTAALSESNAALSTSNTALSQSNAALSESNAALGLAYTAAQTAREHAETAKHQATEALANLHKAQAQLVESAKMASLGHLVASVAHELNTPIGNALTTASILADSSNALKIAMLQDDIRKSSINDFIGDAVQMAEVISRSCQRAATLITSFKQVAADQTSEQRRTFDLHSLVADNIAALRAGFKDALWAIETKIPNGIICDSYPGPLGQVIANLVQNAAIHAFEGRDSGTLKITATLKPGAEVEMLFLDDGNGMEPAILAHIFEPFYTARSGRDQGRYQGGPGLGLSISLNIVTGVLGGTLSASSEPGCGSQFYLTFPLNAPQRNQDGTDTGFISPPA